MDNVRDGMGLSPSFYLSRGVTWSGSHTGGAHIAPGFKTQPNPNSHLNPNNMRVGPIGSSYPVEHTPPPKFHYGINLSDGGGNGCENDGGSSGGAASIATPGIGSDPVVKRKKGRPRIYGVNESRMTRSLAPASSAGGSGSGSLNLKRNRGRPPGSGRVQRLANVGEWMCASAGLAFTPHVIHVETGEDIAAKIYTFAQQRPRGLCIMSANGSVSEVQLRKLASSGGTITYEGPFEILSLLGSYLVSESGEPNSRTGGLSISLYSPDIHVIGGAIGGRLIASSRVQVVAFSFVYGGNNSKNKTPAADEESPNVQLNDANPAPIAWPQDSQAEMTNSHTEIDLTRG